MKRVGLEHVVDLFKYTKAPWHGVISLHHFVLLKASVQSLISLVVSLRGLNVFCFAETSILSLAITRKVAVS